MQNNRTQRAKLNIIFTLLRQLVATVCGIIIPWLMIGSFGSVVYGATTSIAQFLSYISLFEGGIGRVARGELYKPLALKDNLQISRVYHAVKRFFSKLGILFVIYAIILACVYYDLADITDFNRPYTFFLVLSIAVFTFADYMGGISNLTLMNADQKQYVANIIIMCSNVLNTLAIVALVTIGSDVLLVKLVSSLVFVLRPIAYSIYVKRHYELPRVKHDKIVLKQKWSGFGQHIAYFLHTNTDIVLLTLLADLKTVAVYSIYLMVAKSIWNIASAFSGGMEASFGELIAKKERDSLRNSFNRYKTMLTSVSITLFGTAIILVVPFVGLYTAGVTDANYIQPLFALLLLLAEAINCIVLPCTSIPVSGNQLKQSRMGSYMEAVINIAVSLALIRWNPLLGVAIGTLSATAFKAIYYICYTAKNFLFCNPWKLISRFLSATIVLVVCGYFGMKLFMHITINNYISWCAWGICLVAVMLGISFALCGVLYSAQWKAVWHRCSKK